MSVCSALADICSRNQLLLRARNVTKRACKAHSFQRIDPKAACAHLSTVVIAALESRVKRSVVLSCMRLFGLVSSSWGDAEVNSGHVGYVSLSGPLLNPPWQADRDRAQAGGVGRDTAGTTERLNHLLDNALCDVGAR